MSSACASAIDSVRMRTPATTAPKTKPAVRKRLPKPAGRACYASQAQNVKKPMCASDMMKMRPG